MEWQHSIRPICQLVDAAHRLGKVLCSKKSHGTPRLPIIFNYIVATWEMRLKKPGSTMAVFHDRFTECAKAWLIKFIRPTELIASGIDLGCVLCMELWEHVDIQQTIVRGR